MEWLGDLERLFASSLYPLRVPIALGVAIGFVGLILLARRRGWLDAGRRHPARSAALALALLAVGGPTAWYLGSPLFIRTSVVEPAPIVGAAPPQTVYQTQPSRIANPPGTSQAPGESQRPALADAPRPSLAAARSGTFKGADDFHYGSGEARLIETGPSQWVVRFEGFSVRNGPDLFVYLSPDPSGYADGVIELGRLKATDGSFNMNVPSGSDVSGTRSVVIWCKQFSVQFAVARLR